MPTKSPRRLPPLASWPDGLYFLTFFSYALIVGLLIQLVLLPYVFPSFHAKEGLMSGIDATSFHNLAVRQADRIATEGWSAWQLAPGGQPVSGIASAFYAAFTPHPWVLLPWNSLLHALAGLMLFKTLQFFTSSRLTALLASLPFLLFPSSLTWISQIHNDNYAVLGIILLAYACAAFTRLQSWSQRGRIRCALLSLLFGAMLVWMVRNYIIDMFTAIGSLVLTAIFIIFTVRTLRKQWPWPRALLSFGLVTLAFLLVMTMRTVKLSRLTPAEGGGINITVVEDRQGPAQTDRLQWQKTTWLPEWLDDQMRTLSRKRLYYIRAWISEYEGETAGSNIDTDVVFHSASDILRYLPRAVQVGLLAPFPSDWFDQGSKAPNTMMRRISGFEMFFVYLSLPGLLYALWACRRQPETWVYLFFLMSMLILYVLGTPNMGSLYRFRYPFLMSLVGLGITGWAAFGRRSSSPALKLLRLSLRRPFRLGRAK